MPALQDRRSDHGLRTAISAVERHLIRFEGIDRFLSCCIEQLMVLLDAEVGYAYLRTGYNADQRRVNKEEQEDGDALVYWDFRIFLQTIDGKPTELPNTSNSTYIPESLTTPMILGHCLNEHAPFNHEIPIPKDCPELHNYSLVPVCDQTGLYAVLIICNAHSDCSAKLEGRIKPFIKAASAVMRFIDSSKRKGLPAQTLQGERDFLLDVDDLLNNTFDGLVIINDDNRVVFCNAAAASMVGIGQDVINGSSIEFYLPAGSPPLTRELRPRKSTLDTWHGLTLQHTNGTLSSVDVRYFDIYRGAVSLRVLVLRGDADNSLSKESSSAIHYSFRVLTNVAPVGIIQLNRDWECTYVNDTWCEYSKLSPSESLGIGWINALHELDRQTVLESIRSTLISQDKYEGEFRLQTPYGSTRWVKANACNLYTDTGSVSGLIMTFSDITDHLKTEQALRNLAERDQLTGLTNRAFFSNRMEESLKNIQRLEDVSLMFLDLDDFKHINDTLGHDAGDELLKAVATRLQENLRKVDTIARLGGDEFVVLVCSLTNQNHLHLIADKIIEIFKQPFRILERSLYITCSMGIASASGLSTSSTQLMKQADVALYKAKAAGRNQYRFYTREMDKYADLHIHLRQSLKEVGRNDFSVVYQPQVDIRTGRIVGMEALTRWNCEAAPHIGPDIFMKMIEQSGLIEYFSRWLLDNVLATAARLQKYLGKNLRLSMNLSGRQFHNEFLADELIGECKNRGIEPSVIELEVTETALIDDTELAQRTLGQLRSAGFHIALDDFGTGYSSLAYLRKMPIDTLKIDSSFVQDVLEDQEDAQIVEAILALAKTLRLNIIAEGVEDTRTSHWLKVRNCYIHQGFLYHRPMTEAELTQKLKHQHSLPNLVSDSHPGTQLSILQDDHWEPGQEA
ncbi:sensor domain-containing protein [Oceanobacter kriegii]|uniref:sensor domain-containing protein n=1 Tax=Oceanobacter kriegii TaxID=64972 RepID=UPI0003FB7C37|nr:EAL domain-containing protein [Oceanobacter kriegii]